MKKVSKIIISLSLLLSIFPSASFASEDLNNQGNPVAEVTLPQGTLEDNFGTMATVYAPDQDITAYSASRITSTGGTRLTHSGAVPSIGTVAVRKNSSNQPHIPFGTTIWAPFPVIIPNQGTPQLFTVRDTGVAATQTYYALDIWFGFCRENHYSGTGASPLGCSPSDPQFDAATKFGKDKWDFSFNN